MLAQSDIIKRRTLSQYLDKQARDILQVKNFLGLKIKPINAADKLNLG